MKKFIPLFVFLMYALVAAGQPTQSGYVKTKGRMDAQGRLIPGTRIAGAAITLTSGHSTVSAADGSFTLTVPDRKYFLKNVQKHGYVLTDPDVLSRPYVCSANPLVISMETPQQQMHDQIEAQRKIEVTLRQQLLQREKELESLKKAHKITEEEYYQKLQQLYDEKATESLVKEMSRRYAELDYDLLDSFQQQFSTYILAGELLKADSLLKTKGNLSGDIMELNRLRTANAAEREELERRRARLDTSVTYAQWLAEDIAMRCYNKAEILKLRHQNDSAAYYLELRANLDTTNVTWQLDAGAFLEEFVADYDKAMTYYHRAERQAVATLGERHPLTATCTCIIGAAYIPQGKHTEALDYLNKSLEIREAVLEENHPDIATTYNNIGAVYDMQGQYSSAIEYYQKALDIRKASLGEMHRDVAQSYNSLGKVYNYQGKYDLAVELFQKALRIYDSVYEGKEHPDVALVYNNLGSSSFATKEYDTAIDYFQKALDIWSGVYNEKHPQVALAYNNIGVIYSKKKEYDKAVEYDLKALNIRKSVYGENHPDVAGSYNNVATDYMMSKDYAMTMEYYQKAVDILIGFYGETHPDLATLYKNMGKACSKQGDHNRAIGYYQKALDIRKAVFGEIHPEVAISYNNLGSEYAAIAEYDSSLTYMQRALETRIAFYGPVHYDVAVDYGNIGFVYYREGKTNKAVKYLQKAVEVFKALPDLDPSIVPAYESMIEEVKASKKKKKQ